MVKWNQPKNTVKFTGRFITEKNLVVEEVTFSLGEDKEEEKTPSFKWENWFATGKKKLMGLRIGPIKTQNGKIKPYFELNGKMFLKMLLTYSC